jgi:hypothetical protein
MSRSAIPAHPAPQLVELREAQAVRAVDDDRVRRRDVEARLDDGGGHEHIVRAPHVIEHRSLEHRLAQLAVGHRDPRPRDEPLDQPHEGRQGLDAIVDDEDLPAPAQLALDRLLDHVGVEPADDRLDGEAVGRRRLDHRQVADPGHRHGEGARDRRRRQREDVDSLPELLQALLVRHAEPVLLVHDQEPEVLERDVLREQTVGADDDVRRPRREPGEDGLLPRR